MDSFNETEAAIFPMLALLPDDFSFSQKIFFISDSFVVALFTLASFTLSKCIIFTEKNNRYGSLCIKVGLLH